MDGVIDKFINDGGDIFINVRDWFVFFGLMLCVAFRRDRFAVIPHSSVRTGPSCSSARVPLIRESGADFCPAATARPQSDHAEQIPGLPMCQYDNVRANPRLEVSAARTDNLIGLHLTTASVRARAILLNDTDDGAVRQRVSSDVYFSGRCQSCRDGDDSLAGKAKLLKCAGDSFTPTHPISGNANTRT